MSKPHRIRYLSTAQKDLIDIFEYINKDNPTVAISRAVVKTRLRLFFRRSS